MYTFKQLSFSLVLSILLFCSCKDSESEIRHAFNTYKTAIENSEGDKAASVVDSKTLQWYENMKGLALLATKEELERKNYLTKAIVLALRQKLNVAQLNQMDAREIFAFTVDYSFFNKLLLHEYEIAAVEIDRNKAVVGFTENGVPASLGMKFIKEYGTWKINLAGITNLINFEISNFVRPKESGIDRIEKFVELISGEPIKQNIWQPLVGQKG